MSDNEFSPIAEDSDEIKLNSSVQGGTEHYDYAAVMEMLKKEINQIPPKFPSKENKDSDINESYESKSDKSEKFALKKADSQDFTSPREETANMAYTKSTKKEKSDDEYEYDEDFEESERGRHSDLDKTENSREINNNFKNIDKSVTHTDISADLEQENINNSALKKKTVQFKDTPEQANDNSNKTSQKGPQPKAGLNVNKTEVKNVSALISNEKKSTENKNKPIEPPKKSISEPSKIPSRPASSSLPKKGDLNAEKKISEPKPKEESQNLKNVQKTHPRPSSASLSGKSNLPKQLAPIPEKKIESSSSNKKDVPPQSSGSASLKRIVDNIKPKMAQTVEFKKNEFDGEIEEEIGVEKPKYSTTQTSFRIKTQKKTNHHDLLKQIMMEYKKKQQKLEEKDAKIFAIEETEKRVKKGDDEESKKNNILEENWVGNGLGARPKSEGKSSVRPKPKVEEGGPKSLALKFLANLEKKLDKAPTIVKKDTALKMEKDNALFKTEEIDGGTQSMAVNVPAQNKKESIEGTWKYAIGQGIISEYEKTQKMKEQEYKKKFTELFKKEQEKKRAALQQNLQKQKEMLKRERENRKLQQQKMVKTVKAAKDGISNQDLKDHAVLQVQKVYLDEDQRDKKEREKIEINDLKNKLKLLLEQNEQLKRTLGELENKDTEVSKTLDELTTKKPVISLGKQTFTSFGLVPSQRGIDGQLSDSVSTADSHDVSVRSLKVINEDAFSPIEIIVNKIADQGFTLDQVYQLLDENKDGVLTMKEIKDGFEKLELDLSPKEIQEILTLVDKNTDGAVSKEEFISAFQESLQIRNEYKAIMGDLDKIANPIILEERTLDLNIRRKVLENELKKLNEEMQHEEKEYNALVSKLKKYQNLAGPKEEKNSAEIENYKDTILKLKVNLFMVNLN